MRLILTMATAVLAVTALAACGQSEQSLRTSTRASLLFGCKSASPSGRAAMNQAGISLDQFCTCAIDRYMQTASVDELKQINRDPNYSPAGLDRATDQCAGEMQNRSQLGAGAPSADNGSAAEPAAANEAGIAENGSAGEDNGAAEH